MKVLLRIYEKIDGEVLATILRSLDELDYNTSVEIDSENGCLVIKENE